MHLRAGDILVLVNGEYVVVEKVQHEILESPVKVYNLQVKDYHTYYVANAGVLVHNSCRGDNKLKPNPKASGEHTVFKRGTNGEITNYATYTPNPQNPTGFDEVLRFDRYGSHGGINGSHVHLPKGIVREPFPWEIPK